MAASSAALTLGDASVRQLDGLFSLNDLHAAAGGERKHRPGYFLLNGQTQALVEELGSAGIPALKTQNGGTAPGTYACRELVIAYAAWISPAFHLRVIRVFLAGQAPQQLDAGAATLEVCCTGRAQRSHRARLKRQAVFIVLHQHGVVPPNNTCAAELDALLYRLPAEHIAPAWADVNSRVEQGMRTYLQQRTQVARPALPAPSKPAAAIDGQTAARWLLVQAAGSQTPTVTLLPPEVQVGTWAELAARIEAGDAQDDDLLALALASTKALLIHTANAKPDTWADDVARRLTHGATSLAEVQTVAQAAATTLYARTATGARHSS